MMHAVRLEPEPAAAAPPPADVGAVVNPGGGNTAQRRVTRPHAIDEPNRIRFGPGEAPASDGL